MTRVFFDMDGVLAEYKNVPEEELYKKGYFADLKPYEESLKALEVLSKDPQLEVHTLSAVLPESKYAMQEKLDWFSKYIASFGITPIFMYCGESKREKVPGGIKPTDILIDDYNANLLDWCTEGIAIKFLNGQNHKHGSWQGLLAKNDASDITHVVYGAIAQRSA